MKNKILPAVLALLLAACQAAPTSSVNTPAPSATSGPTQAAPTIPKSTAAPGQPTGAPEKPLPTSDTGFPTIPAPTEIVVGPVNDIVPALTNELMREGVGFVGPVQKISWQPGVYRGRLSLPVDLSQINNPGVIDGLTVEQDALLEQNGFTVLATGEEQFEDIRFDVANRQGQPYYLTTDAAYHAMHVTFDETLKSLEREVLRIQMADMMRALLEEVRSYDSEGTPLEQDAKLAEGYLAVALRLFDPQAELPAELLARIEPQLAQITAAAGRDQSALIPNFEDDYGAYKPVGHYTGEAELENYFRGMTWLGRVSVKLKDPTGGSYQPSRMPLIVTMALRSADGTAQMWKDIDATLDFIIGPSDDPGPAQLAALMDPIYGEDATFTDLADEDKWQTFLAAVDSLPAPQIHSTFLNTTAELEATRDWRLMGQRFTFDASIFQNLIYDKVGTPQNKRLFPTGPDLMAVFGSDAAMRYLESTGETGYAKYNEQMSMLQDAATAQLESEWLSRFYTGWLYSFFPQVQPKGEAYPPIMRSDAWADREMNAALGSWAELKHDTILYNKMPYGLGGGGPPRSEEPPAYVEPNPEVYYRLAYITGLLQEGIQIHVLSRMPDENKLPGPIGIPIKRMMIMLGELSESYMAFGDIAAKELQGAALNQDDFYTISQCLGVVECYSEAYPETPPVPVVAAVAGAGNEVLEAAVGNIDRIFVVVEINGSVQVAQGGVFSYYEFKQPLDKRLTDEQWRDRLAAGNVTRPVWTKSYMLPGGKPTFTTFFREGDWYIITPEGGTPPLNVRAEPSKTAQVVDKLEAGTYVHFVEGPVSAGGLTWWKISDEWDTSAGWVAEDQDWFERAYGQ